MKSPQIHNRSTRYKAGTWFEIKNTAEETASVYIMDEIGEWGVTAADFARDLRDVKAKTIDLHISSNGGSVFDGLAILNTLRQHPAEINVVIDGIAASAASFIAMAGDTIMMAPNAVMMIHDAAAVAWGNTRDMQAMADLLEKTSNNIAAIYSGRAGGTPENWREAMRAETWYSDREAVAAGLADGVVGSPQDNGTNTNAANNVEPVAMGWGFDITDLIRETVK